MRILYQILTTLALPFLIFYWGIKALKNNNKKLWQRIYSRNIPVGNCDVLIHCSSVGEMQIALNLAQQLLSLTKLKITITSQTQTSFNLFKQSTQKNPALINQNIKHFFAPFDQKWLVKSFIKRLNPKCCIIIETEIWLNLIEQLKLNDCYLISANARLSAKSIKHFSYFKKSITPLLNKIDLILAQDEFSQQGFISLGVNPQHIDLYGNFKFDIISESLKMNELTTFLSDYKKHKNYKIWVAASTHNGEDEIVLQTQLELLKTTANNMLILAPRHPQRFKQVEQLIEQFGFRLYQKSRLDSYLNTPNFIENNQIKVFLLDSIGDLKDVYHCAEIAFIGGSLCDDKQVGGHNPIEAIMAQTVAISGDNVANFRNVYQNLQKSVAVITVKNQRELQQNLQLLIHDDKARQKILQAGQKILSQNHGLYNKLALTIIAKINAKNNIKL